MLISPRFLTIVISLLLLYCGPGSTAGTSLKTAIANPEYMLTHWITLPTTADPHLKKTQQLTLREAILLALRYNPNIQNRELDRIMQRYELRLAHNEFELQYALGAMGAMEKSRFSGVGQDTVRTFIASPEMNLKTKLGTNLSLKIDNNVNYNNNYLPALSFSVTQPLLRGFGPNVNKVALLNAEDNEWLNKVSLQQSVIDEITGVILAYRALILSNNSLQNQQRQLEEANKLYTMNEKRIEAGQLEPTGNIQPSYQIESLHLMVEQAANDAKTAAQNLLQLIGLSPQLRVKVPSDITIGKLLIPHLQQSIDIALSHNTQYLAQKIQLRADERAYQLAKNEQRWQLDLGANISSGQINEVIGNRGGFRGIYNGQNTNESANLKLTIPLHDIGRRASLINAKVRLEKDRVEITAMKRALVTTITNSINTIQSQAKRFQLAEKQVQLAIKSYELEKKKQQAGITSALDVNNTQNQLIQAQASLIGAKIAYLNELASLQRLLGTTLKVWRIQLRY